MKEIWLPIPTLPADKYLASNMGRIKRLSYLYDTTFRGKSLKRPTPEKVFELKRLSTRGYQRVNIRGVVRFVHTYIAITFVPNPDRKPQVNHKNGIKTDNRSSNLEWVTNQENRNHAVENGLIPRGSRLSKKLSENDVKEMRKIYASGILQREIASIFNVRQQTVSKITSGRSWLHVPME